MRLLSRRRLMQLLFFSRMLPGFFFQQIMFCLLVCFFRSDTPFYFPFYYIYIYIYPFSQPGFRPARQTVFDLSLGYSSPNPSAAALALFSTLLPFLPYHHIAMNTSIASDTSIRQCRTRGYSAREFVG